MGLEALLTLTRGGPIVRQLMPTSALAAGPWDAAPRGAPPDPAPRGQSANADVFGRAFPDLVGPRRRKQLAAAYGLTRQEEQVLRWLCRGLGNKAIAYNLHICLPTLRTHLRSVYSKLNCCDRVDVILHLIHTYRSPKILSSAEMTTSSPKMIAMS